MTGGGVHDLLAAAVAFAVMLFDIADPGVFLHIEGVDAVVLRVATAAVVDAAARDDGHVGAFADVEIVVHKVCQAGLADDDRDVHALIFGAGLDVDVDAGLIVLADDVDVGGGVAGLQLAVGADVVGADRQRVEFGDLVQQFLFDGVHGYTPLHFAGQYVAGRVGRIGAAEQRGQKFGARAAAHDVAVLDDDDGIGNVQNAFHGG